MVVLDASVVLDALRGRDRATGALGDEVHAPHLIDAEIAHAVRRLLHVQVLALTDAAALLERWRSLAVHRHAMVDDLDRIFALRANVSAYNACYVALAERLGAPLLTADARLARATGPRCEVRLVD